MGKAHKLLKGNRNDEIMNSLRIKDGGRHRGLLLALRVLALMVVLSSLPLHAADEQTNVMKQLTEMSIEDLLNQDVTSVAKKPEQLSKSPAAISVITQEDIQQSGARSIPEALRLVPGMDVAQVDSQQWAVSARGFNDVFANKLLVLQDGRSLYTPLFSGVFWDVQNPLLENIDRIEVIRGPGASLWGANAVNGVINIITKSAADTQGFMALAGGGSYQQDFVAARYGGKLADDLYYRVDGQYFDRGDTVATDGGDAHDAWRMGQASFRMDWDTRKKGGDLVTLQGDIYQGRMDQIYDTFSFPPPAMMATPDLEHTGGGNILGRWSHEFQEDNDLTVQMYYDRSDRNSVIFNEELDTFDIDAQHHFTVDAGLHNDFVWGLGYRANFDHFGNTQTVAFSDTDPTTQLFSAFAQDEITLAPDHLRLTLGTKFEHNDFTGFEVQPDARLLWTPAEHHTVWAAVSRAVRTPSEANEYISLNEVVSAPVFGPTPVPVTVYGNQNMRSEDLLAYQLGYRVQPCDQLSLDATVFYNDYNHVLSEAVGPSPTQPISTPFVPVTLENGLHGYSYGIELAPTWEVVEGWRLQASYSLLETHLDGQDIATINSDVGQSPRNQFGLRSSLDLPHDISFDCALRYVDRLPALGIPSYVVVDLRVAWRPNKHWELALVGQNLGSAHHAEFAPTFIGTQRTEIPVGGYAKVTYRF